jgi:hypothetical protein
MQQYFLVSSADIGHSGEGSVSGVIITEGEAVFREHGGFMSMGPRQARLKVPELRDDATWVLPPRASEHYSPVAEFAAGLGYETIEHEDFRRPEGWAI